MRKKRDELLIVLLLHFGMLFVGVALTSTLLAPFAALNVSPSKWIALAPTVFLIVSVGLHIAVYFRLDGLNSLRLISTTLVSVLGLCLCLVLVEEYRKHRLDSVEVSLKKEHLQKRVLETALGFSVSIVQRADMETIFFVRNPMHKSKLELYLAGDRFGFDPKPTANKE